MAQEFYAQALSGRRALDESLDIGEDKLVIRAEIRLERCEGIIRHFAFGFGKFVQKTGFSRIRQTDESLMSAIILSSKRSSNPLLARRPFF